MPRAGSASRKLRLPWEASVGVRAFVLYLWFRPLLGLRQFVEPSGFALRDHRGRYAERLGEYCPEVAEVVGDRSPRVSDAFKERNGPLQKPHAGETVRMVGALSVDQALDVVACV